MEARSLSALNYAAANPPQYPINPAEQKQEPLTLYISRVPGTRDIILSPFKPSAKNVTVQDVASSLYYVHMDLPPSAANSSSNLLATRPAAERSPSRADESVDRNLSIRRKPLPDTPNSAPGADTPLEVTPARKPVASPGVERRPLPDNACVHPALRSRADSGSQAADLAEPKTLLIPEISALKKPHGPRPLSMAFLADEKRILADARLSAPEASPVEMPPRPRARTLTNELSPLPQDGFGAHGSFYRADHDARPRSRTRSPSPDKAIARRPAPIKTFSLPSAKQTPAFTLVLIRRDPSTGHQWNVGRITSSPQTTQYLPGPRSSQLYPPIDVEIENTGYQKFKGMNFATPSNRSTETANALEALMGRREEITILPGEETDSRERHGRSAATPAFSRRVSMAYSKSWTSTMKEKIHQIDNHGWKRSSINVLHGRSPLVSSTATDEESAVHKPPFPTEGADMTGMRPRGYTFTSPWSGQCDFRTGNDGRSVRCLHTLRNSGSYNPLVDQAEDDEASSTKSGNSNVISELRFNLPRKDVSPATANNEGANGTGVGSASQRVKGHFSKFLRHGSASSNSDEDWGDDEGEHDEAVSPFDVNVGAEKAGGGNKGKRAKLGKLIIAAEGLKMLDLLVAANMGVWWGAWEKSS